MKTLAFVCKILVEYKVKLIMPSKRKKSGDSSRYEAKLEAQVLNAENLAKIKSKKIQAKAQEENVAPPAYFIPHEEFEEVNLKFGKRLDLFNDCEIDFTSLLVTPFEQCFDDFDIEISSNFVLLEGGILIGMIKKHGFTVLYPNGDKIFLKGLSYTCHEPIMSNHILILDESVAEYNSVAYCYDINKFVAPKKNVVARLPNSHINIRHLLAFKHCLVFGCNCSTEIRQVEYGTSKVLVSVSTPTVVLKLQYYSNCKEDSSNFNAILYIVQYRHLIADNLYIVPFDDQTGLLQPAKVTSISLGVQICAFEVVDRERIACMAYYTKEMLIVNISNVFQQGAVIEKRFAIPFEQCCHFSLFAKNTLLIGNFEQVVSSEVKIMYLVNVQTEQIVHFNKYFEPNYCQVSDPGTMIALGFELKKYKISSKLLFNQASLKMLLFKQRNVNTNVIIECVQ